MKSLLILSVSLIVIIAPFYSHGQRILKDMNGKQLLETKYVDIKGSPFFDDSYIKGVATLQNKQTYYNVFLRYDQVQDIVFFKNDINEQNAMTFASPPVEFKIPIGGDTAVFAKLETGNSKNDGFYQILHNGNTTLLKKTKKTLVTKSTYGTGGEEKNVVTAVNYFLITEQGKFIPIKAETKSILKSLGDKQEFVEKFISSGIVDLNKDKGLASVIAYFDSLK
ncbi:MAG TPA: hypothetical protein VF679_12270 [Pedobacter sp.]|jgi:hypothetical protein